MKIKFFKKTKNKKSNSAYHIKTCLDSLKIIYSILDKRELHFKNYDEALRAAEHCCYITLNKISNKEIDEFYNGLDKTLRK